LDGHCGNFSGFYFLFLHVVEALAFSIRTICGEGAHFSGGKNGENGFLDVVAEIYIFSTGIGFLKSCLIMHCDRINDSVVFENGTMMGIGVTHPKAGVNRQIASPPLSLSSKIRTAFEVISVSYLGRFGILDRDRLIGRI
jgi:hypothetical protein